jgi:LPS O-antigen subunit length determinant protein (WzzB/FepE family)
MESKDIIIVHPQTKEEENVMKAFMNALKIKFEVTKDSNYNSEFLSKIEKSRKQFEEGEYVSVEKDQLEAFLGLK